MTWQARSPLILAAVVVAALVTTALLVGRTISRAHDAIARDAGNTSLAALRDRFRTRTLVDSAALAELIEDQYDEGLRYVALIGPDGTIVASAGEARGTSMEPGTMEDLGDRRRVVRRRFPGRGARPERAGRAVHPPPRDLPGSGPLPGGADARGGGMIVEYVPHVANQLAADARILLAVAVAVSLVVVGFAAWLVRGARHRDRLQSQLEHGRRLAALGEMSAVIAHEVRNPLASLKGHAQLLVETLPEAGPARIKADRVVTETVKLERLTNDLLEFVRTGEPRRAPTDVRALVADVIAETGSDRVDLVATGALDGWSLDAGRLRQALTNIIQNAIQASPADQRVEVAVDGAAAALTIAVRDRGPGIPAGEELAIFEPFHTRRAKGIGLGLAIARRMVELHGGTIAASRRAGGGTELRITLPRRG